ncbi:MAG: Uma2 family endonuclease [Armatimonadetes bacterium]|nr:Uma2 family endonuclease [Armatimonadota bacterium]
MAVAADKLSWKMTFEDYLRLPRDGRKYEYVDGEAKEVPTNYEHDVIGAIIIGLLTPHAKGRGYLTLSQAGFRMTGGNLRIPDAGFTRKERLPGGKPVQYFPDFAPDLCIEVVSPSEDRQDMTRKIEEYFNGGAQLVWHVFPAAQKVVVYTSPTDAKEYAAEDELSGGDLLPGFTCRVADLFAF